MVNIVEYTKFLRFPKLSDKYHGQYIGWYHNQYNIILDQNSSKITLPHKNV